MTTVPFDAHRFQSTAEYYARYRIPYPAELIAAVAARFGLKPGDRVLDLGCGPAMLAIAFAKLGMVVTAMDPEPEMLAAARKDAAAAGVNLTFVEGSSFDLSPALGSFKLVTMGRSFHWMDRAPTLVALDGMVEPGGGIALFADSRRGSSHNWQQEIVAIADKYLPEGARRGHAPDWVRHEVFLLESAFTQVESIGRAFSRALTLDDVMGRTYSMSVTSPQALGDQLEPFDTAVRARLAELQPDGQFSEVVLMDALLGRRKP